MKIKGAQELMIMRQSRYMLCVCILDYKYNDAVEHTNVTNVYPLLPKQAIWRRSRQYSDQMSSQNVMFFRHS